jgi:hypothetical protein
MRMTIRPLAGAKSSMKDNPVLVAFWLKTKNKTTNLAYVTGWLSSDRW